MGIPRSKKKLVELCRKRVVLISDTLTKKKTNATGATIVFSATIEALDQYSNPLMRTTGQTSNKLWTCVGPIQFVEAMAQVYSNLKMTSRNTWESIIVTRNDQELGNLHELRQCFELWEQEIEKWGCNGLGEGLGNPLMKTQSSPECVPTTTTRTSYHSRNPYLPVTPRTEIEYPNIPLPNGH